MEIESGAQTCAVVTARVEGESLMKHEDGLDIAVGESVKYSGQSGVALEVSPETVTMQIDICRCQRNCR